MNEKLNKVLDELKSLRMVLPVAQYLPSDQLIEEYEAEVGLAFPQDYRTFLKEASDSMLNGKDALRLTPSRDHPRELSVALKEAHRISVPSDWLRVFPEHRDFRGQTIVHHHMDYGQYAIPVPRGAHNNSSGFSIWHPPRGAK